LTAAIFAASGSITGSIIAEWNACDVTSRFAAMLPAASSASSCAIS